MKPRGKVLYQIIIIFSLLGILVSLYLVQNHYAAPTAGALCDFGETLSCSLVNTSTFSVLLNVPVALLGALWFLFAGWMAWKGVKKGRNNEGAIPLLLLGWSILGLLFVVYFIIAEIILQAVCPFCTVAHLLVVIILVLSIILFKTQARSPSRKLLFL